MSTIKRIRRMIRRCQFNVATGLSVTRRSHGQYFITFFVFLGIFIFAILHTIISMMITNVEYKQTGYLDLYLENTNICWRNQTLKMKTHDEWSTGLEYIDCGKYNYKSMQNHLLQIHQKLRNSTDGEESSIRAGKRFIFRGNCSHLMNVGYSPSQPTFIEPGACFEYQHNDQKLFFATKTTTSFLCLPSFLIVGTMKGGTGEIMKWLKLHPFLKAGNGFEYVEHKRAVQKLQNPQEKALETTPESDSKQKQPVSSSDLSHMNTKEVHFFSKYLSHHHDKHHQQNHDHLHQHNHHLLSSSEKWNLLQEYLHYFPPFSTETEVSSLYTFEKSPDYMRNKQVLELIYSLFPKMKIIVQVRNPSKRAISEFFHNCRKKRFIKLISSPNKNRNNNYNGSNLSYSKGMVLKNSFELKDFHQLKEDENDSSGEKNDRFTVNAKSLPINSYITMPYPCSMEDMITYFTQFDPNYGQKGNKRRRRLQGRKPSDANTNSTNKKTSSSQEIPITPAKTIALPAKSNNNNNNGNQNKNSSPKSPLTEPKPPNTGIISTNTGGKSTNKLERTSALAETIIPLDKKRSSPFQNLPLTHLQEQYPKEILNGFYYNQINNLLSM
jgi:hypothetical protein